mmetsp:Transcript_4372/g.6434  ORF Transcript_4372/g.6434 Transcript_4372/m.6434 type:complete len:593 (+) Transcript_4372:143-1921(+)
MGNHASTTLATLDRTRNIATAISQSQTHKKSKKSKELTIKQIYKNVIENRVYNIGIYGLDNSGKSTLGQLCEEKYTKAKIDRGPKFYMRYIHSNLLLGIFYLLEAARTFFNFNILQRNENYVHRIYLEVELLRTMTVIHEQFYLSRITLRVINELWRREPAIKRVYRRRHEMFFLPNWSELINYVPELIEETKKTIILEKEKIPSLMYHRSITEPISIQHSLTKEFDGHFKIHLMHQHRTEPAPTENMDIIFYMINLADFARRTDDNQQSMLDSSLTLLFDIIQRYPQKHYYIFLTHFDIFERVAPENTFIDGPKLIRPTLFSEDIEQLQLFKAQNEMETCPLTINEYNYLRRLAYPKRMKVEPESFMLVEGKLMTVREYKGAHKWKRRRKRLIVTEHIAKIIVSFIADGPTLAFVGRVNKRFFKASEAQWKKLVLTYSPETTFYAVTKAFCMNGSRALHKSVATAPQRAKNHTSFSLTNTNQYIPEKGIIEDFLLGEENYAIEYTQFLWKQYYITNGYASMRYLKHLRRRIDTVFGVNKPQLQSVHVVNTLKSEQMQETLSHLLLRYMERHIDAELHRLSEKSATQPLVQK